MKLIYTIILVFIVSIFTKCYAQTQPIVEFNISSMNSGFAITGIFQGEYRIYNDFIEINFVKSKFLSNNNLENKRKRLLKSMTVGLGKNLPDGKWDMTNHSLSYLIDKPIDLSESYNMENIKFLIPKDLNIDLSKNWIIIQLEITELEGATNQIGYVYAHSNKDIFNINKVTK